MNVTITAAIVAACLTCSGALGMEAAGHETASECIVEPVSVFSESDVTMLAQTIYGEARGIWSRTEQACIVWTVINRVDAGMYDDIYSALTAPYQFAYSPDLPTVDDYGRDIKELVRDVLERWERERNGETDVGRVLPAGYCWYGGDGWHNWFRDAYSGGSVWDYSLLSPYED